MDITGQKWLSAITRYEDAVRLVRQHIETGRKQLASEALSLFFDWPAIRSFGGVGSVGIQWTFNDRSLPCWLSLCLDLEFVREFIRKRNAALSRHRVDQLTDQKAQRFVDTVLKRDDAAHFVRGDLSRLCANVPLEDVVEGICKVAPAHRGLLPYEWEDMFKIGRKLIPDRLFDLFFETVP